MLEDRLSFRPKLREPSTHIARQKVAVEHSPEVSGVHCAILDSTVLRKDNF